MRTTLDLDDDVLAAARELARAERRSMGAVVSNLARRGLTAPSGVTGGGFADASAPFKIDAWPTIPIGRGPVTNEHVRRAQEDADQEDAIAWDHERDAPRDFSKAVRRPDPSPR